MWTQLNSPTSANLKCVFFANQNIGWIVSYTGEILATTEGGNSWNDLTPGTKSDLRSIHFINGQIGFTVVKKGVILSTKNGGHNWL